MTRGREDLNAGVLRKRCRRGAGPQAALDGDTTEVFARKLIPGETLKRIGDGDLSYTNPPDNEIHAGCFGDVSVVAAEFGRRHAFEWARKKRQEPLPQNSRMRRLVLRVFGIY